MSDLMSNVAADRTPERGTLVFRLLLAVDIQGYSARDPHGQLLAQSRLRDALDLAARNVGLDRGAWQQQTSGDGELAVLPEDADIPTMVGDYPIALAAALTKINAVAPGAERPLRVRLALHHGPLRGGPFGPVGDAPIVVSRLLDAAPLRRLLDTRDLAYVISDSLYDDIVQPGFCSLRPAEFHGIKVLAKGLEYRGHMLTRQVEEARRSLSPRMPFRDLVEQSSLGTSTARHIRSLSSLERAAAIRARAGSEPAVRSAPPLPPQDHFRPPASPGPSLPRHPADTESSADSLTQHSGTASEAAPAASPEHATTAGRYTGFWEALSPNERAALREVARPRAFAPKVPLCYQGDQSDHIMIIEQGWAKVTASTDDGHEVVLAVRGPADLIGESAVLGGRQRSATVVALGPLHALVVPAADFTEFLDENPGVWQLLSRTFTRRLDDADRRLESHVSANGTKRLALLLAELAEMSAHFAPSTDGGGIRIAPPLSQEELGSWMDASRETVARALQTLRRRGLIRTGWRHVTVTDLPALRAYANDEEAATLAEQN
ncbi:cyclic nucleotide-binding domain-containing protein [Actinomadura macra]|uniref:cyclic nucleotide-binding domain-containing protein n=1 Tax=Actinomadura macra TaxID=46164 RepID=UPI000A48A2AC|nr:cyclic nucleotide-binding domain-containing protein [Actinomadura macra]